MDRLETFAGLSNNDIDALLRWFLELEELSEYEDSPEVPDAVDRLAETLRRVWAARGCAPWGEYGMGPFPLPRPFPAIPFAEYFCMVCNKEIATCRGQGRITGIFLDVCAPCVETSPLLLREGEMPPMRDAVPAALPAFTPFPQCMQISKTGVAQPLVLGDVLLLGDQGTWRIVGVDAEAYEAVCVP